MTEKIVDQGELNECTSEESKRTKRKITYTRSYLLSLHDWETCSDLPSDFDSSILQELYDDGSIGIVKSPYTECSTGSSSDCSEYDGSLSFRWWNMDSNSQRIKNPGNSSQETSRFLPVRWSWKETNDGKNNNQDPENSDKDGVKGIVALPNVSGDQSTAAASAPLVEEIYQLKKSDNPYRPPHTYKDKNGKAKDTLHSGKGSPVTSLSNVLKKENSSAKGSPGSEHDHKSSSKMKNSTVNLFPSEDNAVMVVKELPVGAAVVTSDSSAILNKQHFDVEANSISVSKNTRCSETPKPTSGMSFMEESRPDLSIQIGSYKANAEQDGSKHCGSQFPDEEDDFLQTVLDDSGAYEMSGDCFLTTILDDCGAFDMCPDLPRAITASFGAAKDEQDIKSSPLALSHAEASNSKVKICFPDEDSLLESITTALLVPHSTDDSSEIADLDEICLPDEDSLITLEDLIGPFSFNPQNENPVHTQNSVSVSNLNPIQGSSAPSPYNSLIVGGLTPQSHPNILYENTAYYSVLDQPGNQHIHQTGPPFPYPPMNLLTWKHQTGNFIHQIDGVTFPNPPVKQMDFQHQPGNFIHQYEGTPFPTPPVDHLGLQRKNETCSNSFFSCEFPLPSYQRFGIPETSKQTFY